MEPFNSLGLPEPVDTEMTDASPLYVSPKPFFVPPGPLRLNQQQQPPRRRPILPPSLPSSYRPQPSPASIRPGLSLASGAITPNFQSRLAAVAPQYRNQNYSSTFRPTIGRFNESAQNFSYSSLGVRDFSQPRRPTHSASFSLNGRINLYDSWGDYDRLNQGPSFGQKPRLVLSDTFGIRKDVLDFGHKSDLNEGPSFSQSGDLNEGPSFSQSGDLNDGPSFSQSGPPTLGASFEEKKTWSPVSRKRSIDEGASPASFPKFRRLDDVDRMDIDTVNTRYISTIRRVRVPSTSVRTEIESNESAMPAGEDHHRQLTTPTRIPGSWPVTPNATMPNDQPRQDPPNELPQQAAPAWDNYTAPLYGAVRRICALRRGVTQVVAGAVGHAWTFTGTAAQRAIVAIRHRRAGLHRAGLRRGPAGLQPPVHVDRRNLTPEQIQRFRETERLRDRGIAVREEALPFPELSFERLPFSPLPSPPASAASSESVLASPNPRPSSDDGSLETRPSRDDGPSTFSTPQTTLVSPPSSLSPQPSAAQDISARHEVAPKSTVRPLKGTRKHVAMSPKPANRRVSGEGSRTLKAFESAVRKTSRVDTVSHQMKARILRPKVAHALQPSDLAVMKQRLEEWAPIRSSAHLRPAKEKPRVRFREPLVMPSPAVPASPPRAAIDETRPIEQGWADLISRPEYPLPLGRPVSAVSLFYPDPKPIPEGRTESIYAAEWRKIEEKKKTEESPARSRPKGPAVRPLPPAWETRVEEAMRFPNNRTVATTLSGDPLTKKDLATCCTPGQWLNDEVINSYLAHIVDYLRQTNNNAGRHDKPRYHAFNSFFFTNLRDKGYESVRRWGTRAKIGKQDLLEVDTVFIPVHNNSHWTLIVVKPTDRTIEHFDSLGKLSKRHVEIVKTWLRGELGPLYVEKEWRILPSESPQQNNGSDCGVFLLSTAKAVALDLEPLSYGARDSILLRKKIVAELMNGGFEGDFDPKGTNKEVRL